MKIDDLSLVLPVHPSKKPSTRKAIKRLVVHTTDWEITPEDLALYDIQPNHISSTGCPTITYTYLIEKSGRIVKATDHGVVTWHVGNWNSTSLGIALVYKTDSAFERELVAGRARPKVNPRYLPSGEQMSSLLDLLTELSISLKVPPTHVVGHRELSGTGHILNSKGSKVLKKTCPGMGVDLDVLRYDTICRVQERLREAGLYDGKVDGDWGPKSRAAFSR